MPASCETYWPPQGQDEDEEEEEEEEEQEDFYKRLTVSCCYEMTQHDAGGGGQTWRNCFLHQPWETSIVYKR